MLHGLLDYLPAAVARCLLLTLLSLQGTSNTSRSRLQKGRAHAPPAAIAVFARMGAAWLVDAQAKDTHHSLRGSCGAIRMSLPKKGSLQGTVIHCEIRAEH